MSTEPDSEAIIAVGPLVDLFLDTHHGHRGPGIADALDHFAAWLVATGRMALSVCTEDSHERGST